MSTNNPVAAEARRLQPSSTSRLVLSVALLATGFLLTASRAQAPQALQNGAEKSPPASPRTFPAPINLQVLPKDLSGQQVHDIMRQWAYSLGVRCDSCHSEDQEHFGPDGSPRLDFPDDSKPMKTTARIMYEMTEKINSNYVAKVESSGMRVTCGTCHRGEISPEPFAIQSPDGSPTVQVAPAEEEGQQPK